MTRPSAHEEAVALIGGAKVHALSEAGLVVVRRSDFAAMSSRLTSIAEVQCVRYPPRMKCLPRDPCSFCRTRELLTTLSTASE